MSEVIARLRRYLLGWKAQQWRRGTTIYRELLALGAGAATAQKVAGHSRRWRRNSRYELNRVLNLAYFDRLDMVRLS